MRKFVFLDEAQTKRADIEELKKKAETRTKRVPVLRYGDTSPHKCFLLHDENGFYTVLTEPGQIIQDIAAWFSPWA